MNIQSGDLLSVKSGIILESVNCQGVHNAGLAKQINLKYPQVLREYKEVCAFSSDDKTELFGTFLPVKINPSLFVCCLFGQLHYGTEKRHTNYGALSRSMSKVARWRLDYKDFVPKDVHIPFGLACGLGGGDFSIVSELLDFYFPDANVWKL